MTELVCRYTYYRHLSVQHPCLTLCTMAVHFSINTRHLSYFLVNYSWSTVCRYEKSPVRDKHAGGSIYQLKRLGRLNDLTVAIETTAWAYTMRKLYFATLGANTPSGLGNPVVNGTTGMGASATLFPFRYCHWTLLHCDGCKPDWFKSD